MSACKEVGRWITENIRKPVEKFVEEAEEACSEARRWVEREIREKITRRRRKQERRCKRRKCKWWCACCNKWFCWIEVLIEIIVEWVVKVVGEWLVETVCKIVVKVIKIIVEIVITVAKFIVTGVVCLFTDLEGLLIALGDLWTDILGIVGDIGDLITIIVDALSDLLNLTRESLLDLGNHFGPIGRFFVGIIAGVLDIVRRVLDGVSKIIEGIFEIVLGILTLDFCRALEGLTKGVGFGLGQTIFGVTGVLSLASNGIRDGLVRESLRNWIQGQLGDRFDGDRLEDLEERLGIDSSSFGTNWNIIPFICSVSSQSPYINLRALHQEGIINLYEVAGYAPIGCKNPVIARSIFKLVYKDTNYRVSLADLRDYLENDKENIPEFELLAGDRKTLRTQLKVAERKFKQMAIHIDISPVRTIEVTSFNEFTIRHFFTPTNELIDDLASFMERLHSEFGLNDICDLPSGFVFGYNPVLFGLASVFWRGGQRIPTGATIRTSFMTHLFGTIMAHEMGHCFSLCHAGHDGLEHIMYTARAGGDNCGVVDPDHEVGGGDLESITSATIIEYVLLGGEPRFTLEDGRNAWRWILDDAIECI